MLHKHRSFTTHDFFYIFIALIALLVLVPMSRDNPAVYTSISAILSLMVLNVIYNARESMKTVVIDVLVLFPGLILSWFYVFTNSKINYSWLHLFYILFYLYIVYIIIVRIIKSRQFTSNTIFGSISIYIAMGIAFGYLYTLIYSVEPSSFSHIVYHTDAQLLNELVFFSFMTISTVGYGEIMPINPVSSAVVTIEAIFGQLYIAVVIAKVVSLTITKANQGSDANS